MRELLGSECELSSEEDSAAVASKQESSKEVRDERCWSAQLGFLSSIRSGPMVWNDHNFHGHARLPSF